MSILYPNGLFALIGIPVIIIIYIIKNNFTQVVISSTYIWTLSERFLRRRNPLRTLNGLIVLLIQLALVAMIALSAAQPVFAIVGGAKDYLFVLDGSGSMNMTLNGVSRLDTAKEEIIEVINSSSNGSTYTLMYVSNSITWVVEDSTDKSTAIRKIEAIEGSYSVADFNTAYQLAQAEFDANSSLQIYLVTDKAYEKQYKNINVINVGGGEENYAVSNVSETIYTETTETNKEVSKIKVSADIWSYTSDATIEVSLYMDGSDEAIDSTKVNVTALTASTITLIGDASYEYYTVKIEDYDALSQDNEVVVYSKTQSEAYTTLLVYDYVTGTDSNGSSTQNTNESFLRKILTALGNSKITVISISEYDISMNGYGLYIFDSCAPETSPTDGAVWFVNPVGNTKKSSFTVQSTVTSSVGSYTILQNSTSTTKVLELLEGTNSNYTIAVKSYVKCNLNKSFYTLYKYNSDPIIFAGTNEYGNREVVFAFDFHDSDFILNANYVPLMYNLFNYTFPEIIAETQYYAGDSAEINVISGCDSIQVIAPSGTVSYLTTDTDSVELTLSEVGVYTINLYIGSGVRTVYVHSALPIEERYTTKTITTTGTIVSGETSVLDSYGEVATTSTFLLDGVVNTNYRDGVFNEVWIWLAALMVLFVLDWGIYCYEQYQLK